MVWTDMEDKVDVRREGRSSIVSYVSTCNIVLVDINVDGLIALRSCKRHGKATAPKKALVRRPDLKKPSNSYGSKYCKMSSLRLRRSRSAALELWEEINAKAKRGKLIRKLRASRQLRISIYHFFPMRLCSRVAVKLEPRGFMFNCRKC